MKHGKTSIADHRRPLLSRRQMLRQILGTSLSLPLGSMLAGALSQGQNPAAPANPSAPANNSPITTLSAEDDQFLNDVESTSFQFFWEQGSPNTGMVKDRCNLRNANQISAASIAATGFGLTALCIGEQRKFIPSAAALERVFATLRFLWRKLPNHRGFFFHFAHPESGERMYDSEVSSVDTAILLCGVISCREHFRHRAVAELANLILNRVDWSWLAEDTSLLTHGWTPEVGFLSIAMGLLQRTDDDVPAGHGSRAYIRFRRIPGMRGSGSLRI